MEDERSLRAYSPEQLYQGVELPKQISSITHAVEVSESLRLDYTLGQIKLVHQQVRAHTDVRVVLVGSMGMYALLNELRLSGRELLLLEQRIAGGKNDFDIGVNSEEIDQVMSDLGWDATERAQRRGRVGTNPQTIDLSARTELKSFPWQGVEVGGEQILVESPEELIFEKISALVDPGQEAGQERQGEIKWGIDIKILKAFLSEKNQWGELELDEFLSRRWEEYLEETRYKVVPELVSAVADGASPSQVILRVLVERLGVSAEDDPRQSLIKLFGEVHSDLVETLLSASSAGEFEKTLRQLIDLRNGERLDYQAASQQAEQRFRELLTKVGKSDVSLGRRQRDQEQLKELRNQLNEDDQ